MTVRINKKALNLREELTKAQGVVRYEQRQFWMDGLVENGTFDTADGWTLNNSSIANGTLSLPADGVSSSATYGLGSPSYVKKNKRYKLLFEIVSNNNVNFGVRAYHTDSGGSGTYVFLSYTGAVGEHSVVFTPSFDSWVGFSRVSTHTGTIVIDNVRIYEVDENDNVIHSVPLGFKPVHVYEDGLLQREGTNHDYTVVNTGFGYQVKPTVAPSATTETCIIAEREL